MTWDVEGLVALGGVVFYRAVRSDRDGLLLEELARREAAARERVEAIREQIEQLRERLTAEEEVLSRLVITRETVEEVLGEAAQPAEQPPAATSAGDGADSVASIDGVEAVAGVRVGHRSG